MKEWQVQIKAFLSQPLLWLVVGICCCLLSLIYYASSSKKLRDLKQTAIYLKKKEHLALLRKTEEKNLLQQLKTANRDYVEKELESLQFLDAEVKRLQALSHSDPSNEVFNSRLEFLQSGQNRLRFREQNFQRVGQFQEVEIIQEHPVEMHRDDLKALLARVENQSFGNFKPGQHPPSLTIKKFELIKKTKSSDEEVFVVNLELIKHEMVHE